MGILGIENRTENWKTVQHFYGLDDDAKIRLVHQLLKPYGEKPQFQPSDVKIELFWKGTRDHIEQLKRVNQTVPTPRDFANHYKYHFDKLRESVVSFHADQRPCTFRLPLECHNYNASQTNWGALFKNLQNTEIDIVVQSPTHLFIGEAKHESKFGGEGKLILAHQLIRQYVMATILVDLLPEYNRTRVVPFVVGDSEKLASTKNTVQVKFMVSLGWLKDENVLSWDCIEEVRGTYPAARHSGHRDGPI